MGKGRSLELYFIDGKPDGMLTAEISNWFGHVLMTPRSRIKEALKRKESGYTGVYILQGEFDGKPHAYIGEAEDLGKRLRGHVTKMDWWESAVLITSASDNLHKAHVKYLESRLVEMAISTRLMPLRNSNAPSRSSLSEAATANMEEFLETLMMILPAIQVDFLAGKRFPKAPQNREQQTRTSSHDNHIIFELQNDKHQLHATAEPLLGGGLLVHKGSVARGRWAGSAVHNYKKLHDVLLEQGVIKNCSGQWEFTQDYEFTSPSAAGAMVTGNASAPKFWKLKGTDTTYADWEAAQLAQLDTE